MIKYLHPNFGLRLDYKDLDSSRISELIDQYHVIVVDHAPMSANPQQFWEYAKKQGVLIDTSFVNKTRPGWVFSDDLPGLDQLHKTGQEKNELYLHQDGFSYTLGKYKSMMSLKISGLAPGHKTADTAFFHCKNWEEQIHTDRDLKNLYISHSLHPVPTQEQFSERQRTIQEINEKFAGDPSRLKKFVEQLLNRDWLYPDDLDIRPLVNEDAEQGKWLHYSPAGKPIFLGMSPRDSDDLCQIIDQSLFIWNMCYMHQWQPDQLVMWENKNIIHTRIDNATMSHNRIMLRAQFLSSE